VENLIAATVALSFKHRVMSNGAISVPMTREEALQEWLPVIAWGAVIFILSTQTFTAASTAKVIDPIIRWLIPGVSPAAVDVIHALIRKTAHFTEFGILFLLLIRGPMAGRPYAAFMLCVAYALLDEGHQVFVPGRTASLYDVALDSMGALFTRFLHGALSELA
jgi:VanZ family protein